MKRCPFCCEEIQDGAIKCRWCGEMLNTGAVRGVPTPNAGGRRMPASPAAPGVHRRPIPGPTAAPANSSSPNSVFWIVAVGLPLLLVLLVVGILGVYLVIRPKPPATPEKGAIATSPPPSTPASTPTAIAVVDPAPLAAPFDANTARDAQNAWARKLGVQVETTNSVNMPMVLIPPGSCTMGTPATEAGRRPDEGPPHQVTLTKPYFIGKYPVTVGQFRQFVAATKFRTVADAGGGCYVWTNLVCHFQAGANWENPGFAQGDENPVVCVAWEDLTAFCDWLSKAEGKKYRLPTEAEWDHAARAGTTKAYYSGDGVDALSAMGWWRENSDQQTHPVGLKTANAFGLYDVLGNTCQWCFDFYSAAYSPEAQIDPKGPSTGRYHLIRGGSWINFAPDARLGARFQNQSPISLANAGGRIMCEAE